MLVRARLMLSHWLVARKKIWKTEVQFIHMTLPLLIFLLRDSTLPLQFPRPPRFASRSKPPEKSAQNGFWNWSHAQRIGHTMHGVFEGLHTQFLQLRLDLDGQLAVYPLKR